MADKLAGRIVGKMPNAAAGIDDADGQMGGERGILWVGVVVVGGQRGLFVLVGPLLMDTAQAAEGIVGVTCGAAGLIGGFGKLAGVVVTGAAVTAFRALQAVMRPCPSRRR